MGERQVAVVDGSNIGYEEKSGRHQPKVGNLLAVRRVLEEQGYQVIIIIDASFHHAVDDPQQLEKLLAEQIVRQAPAGTDADFFVLKTAEELDAVVVSNDTYEPYQQQFAWIKDRRLPLMIIGGQVELYQPPEQVIHGQ